MLNTGISWTDSTHNFWSGCNKISPGCKFCYMHRIKDGQSIDPNVVICAQSGRFSAPLTWRKGRRIFTCSMSDFFIPDADAWRNAAWEVIRNTPQHEYQILTKRPERIAAHLPSDWGTYGYPHVYLGVSIENQDYTDRLITLANLKGPDSMFKIFLSIEPILGPIDLLADTALYEAFKKVDWVIIGGESGNTYGKYRYRPSLVKWYKKIIYQCDALGIPVFIKQVGTYWAVKRNLMDAGGYFDKKGENINNFPKVLRRRDLPKSSIAYTPPIIKPKATTIIKPNTSVITP